MDAPRQDLPSVVVVVVTGDPGPELDRTLASIVAQDMPCSLLVIDDASTVDPTPQVAAVAPRAFVKRLTRIEGFANAANHVIGMVEGAAYLLICHDDVDLAPDAVRQLVEEALRSDAGIAVPKLVASDDHERLLGIGLATDRTARPVGLVERRELDQHQHDQVREVAAGSGACLLIDATLFADLAGFDGVATTPPRAQDGNDRYLARALAAPELNEDVDLCWRARQRGAKVVAVPAARVGHRERPHGLPPEPTGLPADEANVHRAVRTTALEARMFAGRRNRWRTVVTVHGIRRLVPAVLGMGLQWLLLFANRRDPGLVRASRLVPRRGLGSLLARRRVAQRHRATSDAQLDRLHLSILGRWRRSVSADLAEDGAQAWTLAERTVLAGLRRGPGRWVGTVAAAIIATFVIGSRRLFEQGVPVVGQLVTFPGLDALLRGYAGGWRMVGTGTTAAGPPALAALALLRVLTFGADGLGRTLLTVGTIPLGVLGAWRLARRITALPRATGEVRLLPNGPEARVSALAGIAGAVAYGACPLAYESLRLGRWDALLMYGAAPWLLRWLLSSSGWAPFGRSERLPTRPAPLAVAVLRRAAPLALLTAFVPVAPLVALAMALGLALGSLVVGGSTRGTGPLRAVLVGITGTIVLLAPWSIDVLRDRSSLLGPGPVGGTAHARFIDLLRFHTSPGPAGWLSAALPLAAFLPMLVVGGDRLRWSARLWSIAIVSLTMAWLGERGWLGGFAPTTEVVLVPAALALALAAAIGGAAVVTDLTRQRFGWRQALVIVGAGSLVVASLPTVWSARDGGWGTPLRDHRTGLSWMDDQLAQGGYRIVWLGAARALPGGGWPLGPRTGSDQLAWSMSTDGQPDVRTAWPGPVPGTTRTVGTLLDEARRQGTFRLGQELGPLAVRYLVLVERAAPDHAATSPLPADVRQLLDGQLDLRQLDISGGLRVYENTAWVPRRTLQAAGQPAAEAVPALLGASDQLRIAGVLPSAGTLQVADNPSSGWSLHTATGTVSAVRVGTSMSFVVPAPGQVTLSFSPPLLLRLGSGLQIVLWVLAAGAGLSEWRRKRRNLAELVALLPPEELIDPFQKAFSVDRAFSGDADDPLADVIDLTSVRHRPASGTRPSPAAHTSSGLTRGAESDERSSEPGTGVPSGTSGTGAGVVVTADEPVEGALADELWAEWAVRQGLRARRRDRSSGADQDEDQHPEATTDTGPDGGTGVGRGEGSRRATGPDRGDKNDRNRRGR